VVTECYLDRLVLFMIVKLVSYSRPNLSRQFIVLAVSVPTSASSFYFRLPATFLAVCLCGCLRRVLLDLSLSVFLLVLAPLRLPRGLSGAEEVESLCGSPSVGVE